jgi:hypothetical protein
MVLVELSDIQTPDVSVASGLDACEVVRNVVADDAADAALAFTLVSCLPPPKESNSISLPEELRVTPEAAELCEADETLAFATG